MRTVTQPSDWLDGGYAGNKFVRGFTVLANTFGATKQVEVQHDGQSGPVVPMTHPTEERICYTFATPIKGAHLLRLSPIDTAGWMLWAGAQDIQWEYDQIPETASNWILRATSFGMEGYFQMRDAQFAYTGSGHLHILMDTGMTFDADLPDTGSATEVKQYIDFTPLKGKLAFISTTGSLQIYQQDLEFRIKQWGSDGPWMVVRPLGDGTPSKAQI